MFWLFVVKDEQVDACDSGGERGRLLGAAEADDNPDADDGAAACWECLFRLTP